MSKRAMVSQDDIRRVLKACKETGHERARIHINLQKQTIDILLGEDGSELPPFDNPWDRE